jgi:hypothetical protein
MSILYSSLLNEVLSQDLEIDVMLYCRVKQGGFPCLPNVSLQNFLTVPENASFIADSQGI